MEETLFAGIDVGYGATKTIKSSGEVSIFRSIVGLGVPDTMGLSSTKAHTVEVNGGKYTVGEDVERYELTPIQVRKRNSIESLAYRALVLASFNGDKDRNMAIMTGLPVDYHAHDTEKLVKIYKEILPNARVKVAPQPAGTMFDLVLNSDGEPASDLAEKKVGIIDIGTFTTDLMLFNKMEPVMNSSSTVTIAIDHFVKEVAKAVAKQHPNVKRNIKQSDVEEALKTGCIKSNGQLIDISEILTNQKTATAMNIWSFIVSLWGAKDDIDCYVLSGGGAVMFRDAFTQSNIITPANPVMSNAYGFYKLARRVYGN